MLFFTLCFLFIVSLVAADIPMMINYQGRVTDGAGNPVTDGNYNMRFRIYDASTAGSMLWDSGAQLVAVADGVFNVLLGDAGMPVLDLPFDVDYWLLATFSGVNQLPRQRLGSSGYAYMASGLVPGTEVAGNIPLSTDGVIKAVNTATTGTALRGYCSSTTGQNYGVYGISDALTGRGVFGTATTTTGNASGVTGVSASYQGKGVYGFNSSTIGDAYGVYGASDSEAGMGVYGKANASTGLNYGVFGTSGSSTGVGVQGEITTTTGSSYGVVGRNASADGDAVFGWAYATAGYNCAGNFKSSSSSGTGVFGYVTSSIGTTYGVFGQSDSELGRGIRGLASATTGINYGIHCTTNSAAGYAGYFTGDVHVNGSLSKSSGSFLIDHPLDPENKLLRHNFVESPENLLIYRGVTRLNAQGEGYVELPDYFIALTMEREASIQLTPVEMPFVSAYAWGPQFDRFTIRGEPDRDVSWVVYAERDDPVIRRLGRPVEEEKGPDNKYCNKGRLLDPESYGYPKTMGRDFEERGK